MAARASSTLIYLDRDPTAQVRKLVPCAGDSSTTTRIARWASADYGPAPPPRGTRPGRRGPAASASYGKARDRGTRDRAAPTRRRCVFPVAPGHAGLPAPPRSGPAAFVSQRFSFSISDLGKAHRVPAGLTAAAAPCASFRTHLWAPKLSIWSLRPGTQRDTTLIPA